MRDVGLDEAIRVAGGIGALARKIGISQPSVSNWSRVPAERVVSVEAATGVSRAILRPDLYAEHPGTAGDVDEVNAARAQEYALLSVLLARAPDVGLLERLGTLRGEGTLGDLFALGKEESTAGAYCESTDAILDQCCEYGLDLARRACIQDRQLHAERP